jgi:hypothetical protein
MMNTGLLTNRPGQGGSSSYPQLPDNLGGIVPLSIDQGRAIMQECSETSCNPSSHSRTLKWSFPVGQKAAKDGKMVQKVAECDIPVVSQGLLD